MLLKVYQTLDTLFNQSFIDKKTIRKVNILLGNSGKREVKLPS